jgi:hypothetical protein
VADADEAGIGGGQVVVRRQFDQAKPFLRTLSIGELAAL